MKRKKLIIISSALTLSLALGSTSYAKSTVKKITAIFGSYTINKDGTKQKTVTLANGKTVYIPISEVSSLTGAKVNKSGNTYSITSKNKDIEEMKLAAKMMDTYKKVSEFREVTDLIESMYKVKFFLDQEPERDTDREIRSLRERYFVVSDAYVNLSKQVKSAEDRASKSTDSYFKGTDRRKYILTDIEKSLELLKKSIDAFEVYTKEKTETNYRTFDYFAYESKSVFEDAKREADIVYTTSLSKITSK